MYDYLWLAEDGMKMQGYNGSQLWDTCFAVQAMADTGLLQEAAQCLKKAHHYVDVSQVSKELGLWHHACTDQKRLQPGSMPDPLNC